MSAATGRLRRRKGEGKIKGLTVGGEFSSTISTKNIPVRGQNMTALYHTQFHAPTRTGWVFQFHHVTTETTQNSKSGAPDSCGRAPLFMHQTL
jgi:hypothetical protein